MTPKHKQRILFSGGPLHNSILEMTGMQQQVLIAATSDTEALKDGHTLPHGLLLHRYDLVLLQSKTGCRWMEYHYSPENQE